MMSYLKMLMTRYELKISALGINCTANWATDIVHLFQYFFLDLTLCVFTLARFCLFRFHVLILFRPTRAFVALVGIFVPPCTSYSLSIHCFSIFTFVRLLSFLNGQFPASFSLFTSFQYRFNTVDGK